MLIFSQIIYNEMIRIFGGVFSWKFVSVVGAILIVGYIVAWSMPDFATPFAIGVVPFGLPLMWFGGVLRTGVMSMSIKIILTIAVISSALLAGYLGAEFDMNLKYAEPGIPVLSLLLAMAITWLFIEICKLLSQISIIEFISSELSRASMTIIFMHQFIHFTLRDLGISSDILIVSLCLSICYIGWQIIKLNQFFSGLFLGTFKRSEKFHRFLDRQASNRGSRKMAA